MSLQIHSFPGKVSIYLFDDIGKVKFVGLERGTLYPFQSRVNQTRVVKSLLRSLGRGELCLWRVDHPSRFELKLFHLIHHLYLGSLDSGNSIGDNLSVFDGIMKALRLE